MQGEAVHPRELSAEEGEFLVRLARRAVEEYARSRRVVEPPDNTPGRLMRRGMSFVTLYRLGPSGRELRGCIGFLQPLYPLAVSVIRSAISAASEDPRFPPVAPEELDSIVVEVSILSEPAPVKDPFREVVIGRHGLYMVRGFYSGTLLPEVPVEYCWDLETFLAETCVKAGLPPDAWRDPGTRILAYEGRVFYEEEPRGRVREKDLVEEYQRRCSWLLRGS